jgi:hypothetical protein
MIADAIGLVEALYDLEAPAVDWQRGLVERAIALVPGAAKGMVFAMDAADLAAPKYTLPVTVGFPSDAGRAWLDLLTAYPEEQARVALPRRVTTTTERLGADFMAAHPMRKTACAVRSLHAIVHAREHCARTPRKRSPSGPGWCQDGGLSLTASSATDGGSWSRVATSHDPRHSWRSRCGSVKSSDI